MEVLIPRLVLCCVKHKSVWFPQCIVFIFINQKRQFSNETFSLKNVSQKSNDLLNCIKKFLLLNFYNNGYNKKIFFKVAFFPPFCCMDTGFSLNEGHKLKSCFTMKHRSIIGKLFLTTKFNFLTS